MKPAQKTLVAIGAIALIGLAAFWFISTNAPTNDASATRSLPFELYTPDQIDGGEISMISTDVMPQEGWDIIDGKLQVQLIAGSIPGISVEDVTISPQGTVTVSLEAQQGPSTMDAAPFEIIIDADDRDIESVEVDRGTGEPIALNKIA